YPFERERFWVDAPAARSRRDDLTGTSPRFLDESRGGTPADVTPADVTPAVGPSLDHDRAEFPVPHITTHSDTEEPVGTALAYGVSWRRCVDVVRLDPDVVAARRWIILSDRSALARDLAEALTRYGAEPIVVVPGAEFRWVDATSFVLAPERKEHYSLLLDAVGRTGPPLRIVDFWACLATAANGLDLASTVGIAHGVSRGAKNIELCVVTYGAFDITG